jgi:hypothetical protein
MANTYTLIASSTAGSGGAASFDFTSIPSTYKDLILKMSLRGTNTANVYFALQVRLNASSATSKYYTRGATGTSSTVQTDGQNGLNYLYTGNPTAAGATANTFGSLEFYLTNYTSSANKSYSLDTVGENNSSSANSAFAQLFAGAWLDTSAINQITLYNEYGNFAQYSSASLYGIKNS